MSKPVEKSDAPFDWEKAKEIHTKETVEFLKEVHDTPISEDEFVERYIKLPHNHYKATRHRNRKFAAKQYNRLKIRFGFFGGK